MSLLYLFPFGSWNKFTFPRSLYSLKCSYQLFWLPLLALLEKAMATHSSTLAWKIPWAEEPGRLQSMGSLSRTWLSDFTFTFHFHALEKEMVTHSNVLAWRIPGMGKPGGLPSMGSHRVRHDWSDLAAAAAISHCVHVPQLPYPFICQWTSRLASMS